ncbi:hypothetical protein VE23_12600 [Paenibacillus sp. D9]|nr:hypothetical protein VE23_12600 [Paenibacillus sp. D9]
MRFLLIYNLEIGRHAILNWIHLNSFYSHYFAFQSLSAASFFAVISKKKRSAFFYFLIETQKKVAITVTSAEGM